MTTTPTNDQEARKAGFLITKDLYYRQLTKTSSIMIEQEKENQYICYRIQWEVKPGNHYSIKEEKFYCRGSWRRCMNKAKSIIEFYETTVFKKKKVS